MLKRLRRPPEEGPEGTDSQEFVSDSMQSGSTQPGVLDLNAFDGRSDRQIADSSDAIAGDSGADGVEDDEVQGEDGDLEEDGELEEDEDSPVSWFDRDSLAFLASVGVHVLVVVALASITIATQPNFLSVLINSEPIAEEIPALDIVSDIAYSDTPSEEFGADSIGSMDMALSSAPLIADVSAVEAADLDIEIPNGDVNVKFTVEKAVGLTESPKTVRGMTGVGTTGTDGAVDRVTYEILQSLESKPTLVVWVFDSSISMVKRRQEIRDRFDRIYQQLGLVAREIQGCWLVTQRVAARRDRRDSNQTTTHVELFEAGN